MAAIDWLVICIGNPSRGDDAAGALVAEHLRAMPALVDHRLHLVEDFQLLPEHVEDMARHTHCVIIDASFHETGSGVLQAVTAAGTLGAFSHSLSPSQLLYLYGRRYPDSPVRLYTLGIRAHHTELGALPSHEVLAAAAEAAQSVQWLVRDPAYAHA